MAQCQLCFGYGHSARNCSRLPTFTQPSVPRSLNSAFAGLQIAPYPQANHSGFSPDYPSMPSYDPSWYPDTGASTHMIGNPALLQQRAPYTGPDTVQLGNGDQLPITYTGNMSLPIGSSSFLLNNIYVVPSMRKNLLSIAQFCHDNHVLCAFDANHFYIFDLTSGSLLYQGLCKDGLYKLPSIPSRFQALHTSHSSSSL